MKKTFNTLVFTLAACYCLSILPMIFMGCANASDGGDSGGGSGKGSKTELEKKSEAKKTIGIAGGEVSVGTDVIIKIPASALSEEKDITVKYFDTPTGDEPSYGFLGEVEFGPSGTEFSVPVEVSMKLTGTPKASKVSVFYYDEKNEIWNFVTEAICTDGIAKFQVDHFSSYRVFNITEDKLDLYINYVRTAYNNNYSDSWITEQYLNYLLNDEDIMHTYEIYNDRLYKVCGFLIYSAYHINGKEGDPNDLIYLHGKTNMKGNRYGLCKDGERNFSYEEFKQDLESEYEYREIIHVSIAVYYEQVNTYKITGHVVENLEFEYEPTISGYTEIHNGQYKLKTEYDIEAYITEDEGTIDGSIQFKNADAKLTATTNYYRYIAEGIPAVDVEYFLYKTFDITKHDSRIHNIKGTCDEYSRKCTLYYERNSPDDIIVIDGEMYVATKNLVENPIFNWDIGVPYDCSSKVTVGDDKSKPLLSFILDEGDKSNESEEFKDSFAFEIDYDFVNDPDNLKPSFPCYDSSLYKTKTIQNLKIQFLEEEY